MHKPNPGPSIQPPWPLPPGTRVRALSGPGEGATLPTACTVSISGAAQGGDSSSTTHSDLAADLVVWTAGSAPATGSREARQGFPFPVDDRGAVLTVSGWRVDGGRVG